ncbi:MAG: branched-chain amino acid aminotransferase [Propionibacteriaceae bacterium]|jgi:branched-chain amino acid aminotransferase|nr:branched-chain amino acid aminotransferase [Propionibacteriaceae bacterium]
MTLRFAPPTNPTFTPDARIAEINIDPGFGQFFSDHMALADWNSETGWTNDRITAYGLLPMEPAGAVLHYAQEVFEGLKAYRHADGSVWLFRPDANARRLQESSRRMALPVLPVDDFLTSVHNLVALDERWVPHAAEQSLYIRPFIIANESFLGVRSAHDVIYCCITGPVGAYFKGGVQPVDIWVSRQYSRVANGGTGTAKCGGNYASSLLAQEVAYANGCSQVLFTDNAEHEFVEELGGMNFLLLTKDGELVTPPLNGNILPGITRDSLLKLAPLLGLTPVERPTRIADVYDGITAGDIVELLACGTAAVITPVGSLRDSETNTVYRPLRPEAPQGIALRNLLLDIQYGRVADPFGWTERVV